MTINNHSFLSAALFCFVLFSTLHAFAYRDKSGYYLATEENNTAKLKGLVVLFPSPRIIELTIVNSVSKQIKEILFKIEKLPSFFLAYRNYEIYKSNDGEIIIVIVRFSDTLMLFYKKQTSPFAFDLHYDNQYTDPYADKIKGDVRILETTMVSDSLLFFHIEINTRGGAGSLSGVAAKSGANEFTFYEYPANDSEIREKYPDYENSSCIIHFLKEPNAYIITEMSCSEWHGTSIMFDGYYKRIKDL